MIFTPASATILIIIFIFGFMVGRKTSCMIWKVAFEKWTDQIYEQYIALLEDKNYEIERLKNKLENK